MTDENISVVQCNALDLSAFPDNQYDITLLLGPLYHLYNEEDKQQAIGGELFYQEEERKELT